jgi:hypothetical protein
MLKKEVDFLVNRRLHYFTGSGIMFIRLEEIFALA